MFVMAKLGRCKIKMEFSAYKLRKFNPTIVYRFKPQQPKRMFNEFSYWHLLHSFLEMNWSTRPPLEPYQTARGAGPPYSHPFIYDAIYSCYRYSLTRHQHLQGYLQILQSIEFLMKCNQSV